MSGLKTTLSIYPLKQRETEIRDASKDAKQVFANYGINVTRHDLESLALRSATRNGEMQRDIERLLNEYGFTADGRG